MRAWPRTRPRSASTCSRCASRIRRSCRPRRLRAAGEEAGIAYSVCGAFGPDRDLAHEDPERRQNALDYLDRLYELAAADRLAARVRSGLLGGRQGTAAGRRAPRRARTGRRRAQAHRRARRASTGVLLALEPLNRYETDLVNTAEQGLELCDEIGADNVGLLLDTYHLNIEEKSVGDALRPRRRPAPRTSTRARTTAARRGRGTSRGVRCSPRCGTSATSASS